MSIVLPNAAGLPRGFFRFSLKGESHLPPFLVRDQAPPPKAAVPDPGPGRMVGEIRLLVRSGKNRGASPRHLATLCSYVLLRQLLNHPLLKELAQGKEYEPLLSISDEPAELVSFLKVHPPIPKK